MVAAVEAVEPAGLVVPVPAELESAPAHDVLVHSQAELTLQGAGGWVRARVSQAFASVCVGVLVLYVHACACACVP